MNFNATVLAVEIEKIHKTENEMYKVYSELLPKLSDPDIKSKIKLIRDQELGHVKLVTELISLLRDYISEG